MDIKEFEYLLEEARVLYRNLKKDSIERRSSRTVAVSNLGKLETLVSEFSNLKNEFNKVPVPTKTVLIAQVKDYATQLDKYFEAINEVLQDRLKTADTKETESVAKNPDSDCFVEARNMSEKFDLKTAASLLPHMDGTEKTTKELIDGIELYDALLDEAGKKSLTNYVLKARLSGNAKIRLQSAYATNEALITDIKALFLTKKSAGALSARLNGAKQGGKSIEEFGRTIEDLLLDLTIAQSDGNDEAVRVLTSVNEKLAINVFANGLQSSDMRTIVKARNYDRLSDAIRAAKDEELGKSDTGSHRVFHIQNRHASNRVFRGRNNRANFSSFSNNRSRGRNFSGPAGNNRYNSNNNNYRFQNRSPNFRGFPNRGRGFRGNNNNNRSYCIRDESTSESNQSSETLENQFFRV